jgi:hypothetical protein
MSNMTKMEKESFAQASIEPGEIVQWAHNVLHSDLNKQQACRFLEAHEQEILAAMYGAGWRAIEDALRSERK